jgi:hypothetical protein
MSSKNRNKKKKETIQQTSPAMIQNVPVSPFADYTNFHMLLQQQYPAAQLFMNPMNSIILNKNNAEDKEVIKYF